MGYDIFKLLIIVLLLANERTSENNLFNELNTILLVGLLVSANKYNAKDTSLIDEEEK